MADGPARVTDVAKLRMPVSESVAVRQWGISFIVERATARPSTKAPKRVLSGKDVELLRQPGGWLRSSHP